MNKPTEIPYPQFTAARMSGGASTPSARTSSRAIATVTEISTSVEPLVDAKAASKYLGFKPITVKRMAKAGKLPTIPWPIGNTGKFVYKFKMSQLEAYVESLSRPAAA